MKGLYSISVQAYFAGIKLASLFNTKARLWVEGRALKSYPSEFKKNGKCYWFHCASLGEFEQARPLIEAIKKREECSIILTFFSPSGYEIRKNYSYADWVGYLPYDNENDCKRFLDIFKPDFVFIVKYEFWFVMLKEIQARSIKLYLISGLFRPNQLFFKSYGSWFKDILSKFDYLFVQNKESLKILNQNGIKNAEFCGDTRLDRVLEIKAQTPKNPILENFSKGEKLLIFGSVWPQDLPILKQVIKNNSEKRILIAPHNLHDDFIQDLLNISPNESQRYTKYNSEQESRILVLDTMGMLASAYSLGDIAYVGGGFGKAVHNTMEPAAFGLAIVFGPKYTKFYEAVQLKELGAAVSFHSKDECSKFILGLLKDKSEVHKIGKAAATYVETNAGATSKIIHKVFSE
ncbi:MAG TPA: glycosyltransferase N-terminal domain-containing protein [Bacteroidia bacterium]